MKNLVKYTLFALVAVTLTGCIASDFEDGTLCRDGVLSISVSTSPAGTRGQGANDDMPTEESIVKDLQYFLYVKGSGDTAAPIYAGTITGITDNDDIDNDADRPDTPADEEDKFSKTVKIPASALNALFPKGATECEIYIIANYLDNTKDAEHLDGIDLTKDLANATRKKLKAIELNTTFYALLDDVEITPSSFVMDSEGTDIVSRVTGNTLTSGTIYLTRAAAKVMIEVNVQNAIDVSGNEWEPISYVDPNTNQMLISFYNGVTTGVIDDGTDVAGSKAVTVNDDGAYYMVENVLLHGVKIGGSGDTGDTSSVTRADEPTLWVSNVDFYSYANSWIAGDEEHEPYFKISIPWRKKSDSANWVTYTYTVPIGMKFNRFDRNKLYLIRLNVGALGDLNYLNDSVLSFNVLDWNSQDVNVSLDNPRYLVVNEHNYEMDNVEEILIPYSSSNKCEIVEGSLTISQVDLTTGKTKADHGDPCTAELVTIDKKTYIKVYNDLDNDLYSSGFDFTEYNISVSIQHEGNSAYKETVYITQYPAIYGTADENSDFSDGDDTNDNYGYVWTNGYTYNEAGDEDDAVVTIDNQKVSNFGGSEGYADSDLKANSMYVISVSSVEGTNYIIGDPRTRNPVNSWKWGTNDEDNEYTTAWYTANNLKGESQAGPQNYYPTDANLTGEANNPTYNMIAPKFRVCSSYGAIRYSQSLRNSYGNVKGRCASYQEDGYPAGRWRLPTKAEFELINVLSNKRLLPSLYVTTMDYWCAHGYGRYTQGATSLTPTFNDPYTSGVSVRCVYDDWYWGSEPVAPKNQFTWGDEPRPTATAK